MTNPYKTIRKQRTGIKRFRLFHFAQQVSAICQIITTRMKLQKSGHDVSTYSEGIIVAQACIVLVNSPLLLFNSVDDLRFLMIIFSKTA